MRGPLVCGVCVRARTFVYGGWIGTCLFGIFRECSCALGMTAFECDLVVSLICVYTWKSAVCGSVPTSGCAPFVCGCGSGGRWTCTGLQTHSMRSPVASCSEENRGGP